MRKYEKMQKVFLSLEIKVLWYPDLISFSTGSLGRGLLR